MLNYVEEQSAKLLRDSREQLMRVADVTINDIDDSHGLDSSVRSVLKDAIVKMFDFAFDKTAKDISLKVNISLSYGNG
jgi:hypothetical protein